MWINENKIKIENVEVAGLSTAIRGMRNPMDSWHLSDTTDGIIGPADMKLCRTLIKAGPEHRKFLRQIYVAFDVTLPRYVWSEFDTYSNITKNSCSTMHKLFKKDCPITLEQIVYNYNDADILIPTLARLNILSKDYFIASTQDQKDELLRRAKAILPEGFLQKRTVSTNYEQLRNIYRQRINHRLPCWRSICEEFEKLPYGKEFIVTE